MNNKLTGAYQYTYKQIVKNINKGIKRDLAYKSAMQDLYEMFYNLESNQLDIPSEFLNFKLYAKSIEEGLNFNPYHTFIRTTFIVVSTVLALFTSFFSITFLIHLIPPLYTPIIEIQDNQVYWDAIDHADYYRVYIDEDSFITTDTNFEFVPTKYGYTRILVVAESNNFLVRGSKYSNPINYYVDNEYTQISNDLYSGGQVVGRTNALGEIRLHLTIASGGYHEIVFSEYMNLAEVSVDIMHRDVVTSFGPNQTVGFYFEAFEHYIFTIYYNPMVEIEFILAPNKVASNALLSLLPRTNNPFEFVSPIVDEAFIILSNYDPNIFILPTYPIFDSTGIPNARFVWMQPMLYLYNNSDVTKTVQLITKTPTPVPVNQNYPLTETNQVKMLKLDGAQFGNQNILYIEFDSAYYDIFFMDHFLREVQSIKYESDFDKYSVPTLFRNDGYAKLYITLVPKDDKVSGSSRIKINTTLPDGMTFWPH